MFLLPAFLADDIVRLGTKNGMIKNAPALLVIDSKSSQNTRYTLLYFSNVKKDLLV